MFFHGIPLVHLVKQAPVLSPAAKSKRQSPSRQADANRLKNLLGFEPVHLLRSSKDYPRSRCIRECFRYGDTVWAFHDLTYPRIQLSRHEWGVQQLDLREACWVLTARTDALSWFYFIGLHVPVWVVRERRGWLLVQICYG
ncbi:hypothetical protein [Desmospora profundinema]|uniref:Uncharacterized protein n=1 Tax=Desmospora profundinema TaxID=1571184 RepID=A0ABU1IQQ7_9BACL|nr:hypothetical protein [Desmospora profundinema]MDR6226479.1 hypothetical protein [Desmospora profundinema]